MAAWGCIDGKRRMMSISRVGVLALISLVFAGRSVVADTIYVDTDSTGPAHDGSSWCDAYLYLQDALAAAVAGDEIRVAEGVYKPDQGGGQVSGDREATFQLISGVTIAGGYAGCGAPDPNERDIAGYETILSGDLTGDDVVVAVEDLISEPTRAENSYHVVTGSGTDESASLDGCIMTGGHACEPGLPHSCGGGMYIVQGAPTVTNCTFRGNVAVFHGGGMENSDGSMSTVSNCTFIGNFSYNNGGGMSNRNDSNSTVTDCTFSGNSTRAGGGMYNYESDPRVTNCTFIGNSASAPVHGAGGGMLNFLSGPTVINCTFRGNAADNGGGMYNDWSSPLVTNCKFRGNVAVYHGGGMLNWTSSPTLRNCTFGGNSADGGGGMYNAEFSSPLVTNCILWDDVPSEIYSNKSTPTVAYSNIQGGWQGVGNIDADPLFVPGPDGCFYLSQVSAGQAEDSPCVDAGSDTAANLGFGTLTTRSDEAADTGIVDMGYHYPVTGLPLVMGDDDHNQLVNLADFAGLQNCLTGSGAADLSPCCRIFDFESDDDVDLDDYAAFEAALSSR